jgi:hypothetical protein
MIHIEKILARSFTFDYARALPAFNDFSKVLAKDKVSAII